MVRAFPQGTENFSARLRGTAQEMQHPSGLPWARSIRERLIPGPPFGLSALFESDQRFAPRLKPANIQRQLTLKLQELEFAPPVFQVYNPLQYARRSAELYLERYFQPGVEALWLGMNPGPWGMAQTGVPFGEVNAARDWLGLRAPVRKPNPEHPKRPIQGFDCPRSEVSGRRLWGWAQERFGAPERFFERFFVWNYCPLVFMEEGGKNRTPDKLPAHEREPLFELCDWALQKLVDELQPQAIIGVGRFAQKQAARTLQDYDLPVHTVLHPSPASPIANRGWAEQAEKQLLALGYELP